MRLMKETKILQETNEGNENVAQESLETTFNHVTKKNKRTFVF